MPESDDQERKPPSTAADRGDGRRTADARPERAAAAARIEQQTTWVDLQIRQAMARGEFDDLPGKGKPIAGLGGEHDPDWWVKRLVEREQITGVLPPALQIRKEDAELDSRLDRLPRESDVRREVEEFNARVKWALYRPTDWPPVVTRQRDPDTEVERWAARREERRRAQAAAPGQAAARADAPTGGRWRLFRRRRR